jgi:hypothetical protein
MSCGSSPEGVELCAIAREMRGWTRVRVSIFALQHEHWGIFFVPSFEAYLALGAQVQMAEEALRIER